MSKAKRYLSLRKVAALFPLDTKVTLIHISKLPLSLYETLSHLSSSYNLFACPVKTAEDSPLNQHQELQTAALPSDYVLIWYKAVDTHEACSSDLHSQDGKAALAISAAEPMLDISSDLTVDNIWGYQRLACLNQPLQLTEAFYRSYPIFKYVNITLDYEPSLGALSALSTISSLHMQNVLGLPCSLGTCGTLSSSNEVSTSDDVRTRGTAISNKVLRTSEVDAASYSVGSSNSECMSEVVGASGAVSSSEGANSSNRGSVLSPVKSTSQEGERGFSESQELHWSNRPDEPDSPVVQGIGMVLDEIMQKALWVLSFNQAPNLLLQSLKQDHVDIRLLTSTDITDEQIGSMVLALSPELKAGLQGGSQMSAVDGRVKANRSHSVILLDRMQRALFKQQDPQSPKLRLDPRELPQAERYMRLALAEAQKAFALGEVPVGAVLVDSAGKVIASGFNHTITAHDITSHAEMEVFRQAGLKLENHRLNDLTLYVTLEPCCMCAMAAVHARVKRIVYGADEPKTGACGSQFSLAQDRRHNHRLEVFSGVLAAECRQLMQNFFAQRRQQNLQEDD